MRLIHGLLDVVRRYDLQLSTVFCCSSVFVMANVTHKLSLDFGNLLLKNLHTHCNSGVKVV